MTEFPDADPSEIDIPSHLPLLPVRDIVVFPYMVLPLFVGRPMSVAAIEAALAEFRRRGISTLLHADQKIFSILFGLYSRQTTVVYGD